MPLSRALSSGDVLRADRGNGPAACDRLAGMVGLDEGPRIRQRGVAAMSSRHGLALDRSGGPCGRRRHQRLAELQRDGSARLGSLKRPRSPLMADRGACSEAKPAADGGVARLLSCSPLSPRGSTTMPARRHPMNTVRFHLKTAFARTGVRRQATAIGPAALRDLPITAAPMAVSLAAFAMGRAEVDKSVEPCL